MSEKREAGREKSAYLSAQKDDQEKEERKRRESVSKKEEKRRERVSKKKKSCQECLSVRPSAEAAHRHCPT